MNNVRVVVVDDSATVRAVLRRIFAESAGIEVVGEAVDGRHGVEQTLALKPDVVIMDLDLPVMNGVAASAEIMQRCPTPIVVVTSTTRTDEVAAAFATVKQGVVGIFPKPGVPDGWDELSKNLTDTIRELGPRQLAVTSPSAVLAPRELSSRLRFVALGASTGGPGAICDLLRELGSSFPVGVAVVQHITAGFEDGLAEWLCQELGIPVGTAVDGESLRPGTVRIAPASYHLRLSRDGVLVLDGTTPPIKSHRPSVNVLFESMLELDPNSVAAVLLSGMGDDGVDGMLSLRSAGAYTVAQDEETCAVFGMPREALKRGATDLALSPDEIGRTLLKSMGKVQS